MNKAAWASFWTLGFIWGSSFLLIRIGVAEMSATQVVLTRTVVAAIGLNIVRIMRGVPMPRDWPTIRAFIFIGVGNVTIPYTLISLAEQNITSGMAAVLQATASLFTLVIAHFAFSDERITTKKIMGLTIGFSGIVVLSSQSFSGGELDSGMLLGQMGMVLASLFYATFITYSRKVIRRDVAPLVVASGTFIPAAVFSVLFVILEPLLGGRAFISPTELPLDLNLAVFGLGFVNTFIAYLFFYYIIQQLGAFRASMVTYIVPVVGLALGALVLSEEITVYMLAGATLIFTGIAIVNVRFDDLRRSLSRRGAPAEAA